MWAPRQEEMTTSTAARWVPAFPSRLTVYQSTEARFTSGSGTALRDSGSTWTTNTLLASQIYEDAEDGTTDGWDVYDNNPTGATIENVYDSARQSQVIVLSGSGTTTAID